jgi:Grx4 family monothiol glutaredoxin
MANVFEIKSVAEYESVRARVGKAQLAVLTFWTEWNPPSQQVRTVASEIAKSNPHVFFLNIEAEQVSEVTEKYPVTSVPTVILEKDSKVIGTHEGADVPKLVELVTAESANASSANAPQLADKKQVSSPETQEELNKRLTQLVSAAPVMVFMKGQPSQPKCKFSRQLVEILTEVKAVYSYFDILTDDTVRQGLKTFSNWPTFPQLYIKGKLVGGLDVIKEHHAEGELAEMLPKASSKDDLNKRLEKLTNQAHVMLFMKGDPRTPRCGFSSKIVALLQSVGAEFDTFDILMDQEVRQGLKEFSNWPTFPQLYVDGKLLGGLDIAQELHEEGELAELVAPSAAAVAAANGTE